MFIKFLRAFVPITVRLQEICRLEGLYFSCPVNLIHTYILVPMFCLGSIYRGLRVVILSTPGEWRMATHSAIVALYFVNSHWYNGRNKMFLEIRTTYRF